MGLKVASPSMKNLYMRAVKALARLRISAASPEPLLLAYAHATC